MMSLLHFELFKLKRRLPFGLLILTLIFFPALIKVLSYLNAADNFIPEGSYVEETAFGIIKSASMHTFLPVWILVIIGIEFSNGHVQRVVFFKNREFYFIAKLLWCLVVSSFFSLLSVFSLWLCVFSSPYSSLVVPHNFYFGFFFQTVFSYTTLSLILLPIVFFIKDVIVSFVVYFVLNGIEGVIYMVAKGLYQIDLYFLPFRLPKFFYASPNETRELYISPAQMGSWFMLVILAILILVLGLTYIHFKKISLKGLSD
jgi:hypothetical protein